MQITMLGTGHGKAVNCYNYCFLMRFNNTNLLVDSGGGVQIIKQLKNINMSVEDIDNVFISHAHMDHILGLIWIIRFLCPKYYNKIINKKVNIFGNKEVIEKIKKILKLLIPNDFETVINDNFIFIELADNQCLNLADVKMIVFDIKSKNIKEFGFLMEYKDKKIIYLGDEKFNELNEKYIKNCDYAFMDARDITNPINSLHSTIEYSAKVAQKYNVKNLILSHSNDNDILNRKELFTNEASKYYNGNIFVPNDMERINIG